MFRDEATIRVKAGRGGDGCLSFRREKYVPRGGPDGGDGGPGGDVVLKAVPHMNTLLPVARKAQYAAGRGQHGRGKNMTGASGKGVVVEVPIGTIVRDADRDLLLKDLKEVGDTVVAARGGKGGFGNRHYASPTNQAPRQWTRGEPGEERILDLELKLIADVGLVGLPNAGKSTLLSRLSKATPKIADYPFTTLAPSLGIVELSGYRTFVMADLPGLIEGAHEGAGLGDKFLRHIERTRLIVHLVDLAPPPDSPSPAQAWKTIREELAAYSRSLAEKREILVATKMDLPESQKALEDFQGEVEPSVFALSAVTGRGLDALLGEIARRLFDPEEV
ncbi:MAG: GTPase ObgE [Planctomycetota bacterium]|jgi:GTP-binding protein